MPPRCPKALISAFQNFSFSAFIPHQMIEEERVVGEVAFEEAAGFHGEAVGPFEAEALEDGRDCFTSPAWKAKAAPMPK